MKKILMAMAVALGFGASAISAQEVTVSYGAYTQMDATNCHKGMSNIESAWGSINLGLYIPVAKGVYVGPSYSFSSARSKSFSGDAFGYEGYDFHNTVSYHSILLNAKVNYYHNSIVTLYGHVGVGAVISHMQPKFGDSWNKGYFAGQISPVGATVNLIPHLDMFGELGFGAQGLVQVGAKYTF